MDKLMTRNEVAEVLRVSDRTIDNYIKHKGLKYVKFGTGVGGNKLLFKEKDVEEFISTGYHCRNT